MGQPASTSRLAWRAHRRVQIALMVFVGLGLAGWVALWFRSPWRWVAFLLWGAGCVASVILGAVVAFWPCPGCGKRGFGTVLRSRGCPFCGARPPPFGE